jgi:two-component system, LytTR family, response regulator
MTSLACRPVRTVISDVHPQARAHLAELCEQAGDIRIVAQAGSGSAAIQACRTHHPELLLLDTDLRDMSGFDVLRALGVQKPLTILISADAGHALEAFANEAVDFLLKPLNPPRFAAAIERARARNAHAQSAHEPIQASAADFAYERRTAMGALPRLVGERSRRLYFLPVDTIDYIEADANYALIHVGSEQYISRSTLKYLSTTLAPFGFLRIERSLLVNVNRAVYAERAGPGEFAFVMRGGRRLESGRTFRQAILRMLRFGTQSGAYARMPKRKRGTRDVEETAETLDVGDEPATPPARESAAPESAVPETL